MKSTHKTVGYTISKRTMYLTGWIHVGRRATKRAAINQAKFELNHNALQVRVVEDTKTITTETKRKLIKI